MTETSTVVRALPFDEVIAWIKASTPESRIYIGSDSVAFQKEDPITKKKLWYADYSVAICIHKIELGVGRGGKVFGEITRDRIFDQDKRKPSMRLMSEAYRLEEMYHRLEDSFEGREVELHIDINRSEKFASNLVLEQAIGYLKGTTGIVAYPKPDSPAASFVADRLDELLPVTRRGSVEFAA
jgi:uncharacterized protein